MTAGRLFHVANFEVISIAENGVKINNICIKIWIEIEKSLMKWPQEAMIIHCTSVTS